MKEYDDAIAAIRKQHASTLQDGKGEITIPAWLFNGLARKYLMEYIVNPRIIARESPPPRRGLNLKPKQHKLKLKLRPKLQLKHR